VVGFAWSRGKRGDGIFQDRQQDFPEAGPFAIISRREAIDDVDGGSAL